MNIEANIRDAITDLTAEMANGADAIVAAEIAADYQIKPEVLLARFERHHGVRACGYAARLATQSEHAARAAEMDAKRIDREWERELEERKAIAEFFSTHNHGLGRGVTGAARDYLNTVR